MEPSKEFYTAHWLGKCPAKNCRTIHHVDVSMVRERWQETELRFSGPNTVSKSRVYPAPGHSDKLYNLGLHCAEHKREILWQEIKGTFSAKHKCDARCMSAFGHNCECSCGGRNHGRGYHTELAPKEQMTLDLLGQK